MDNKLLLIRAITLLFRESQRKTPSEDTIDLVKEVIGCVDIPKETMGSQTEREILVALVSTLELLIESGLKEPYDKDELLQRIRINVGAESFLYNAVEDGIAKDTSESGLTRRCNNLRAELRKSTRKTQVKSILQEASRAILFDEKNVDWDVFVRNTIEKLDPFINIGSASGPASRLDMVNLNNRDEVKAVFKSGLDSLCGNGIMRTGFHGVNNMLDGGIRRGDMGLIGALRHNYKSGMLLDLPRQVAMYNEPYMFNGDKTPLIWCASLENELRINIIIIYNSLTYNTGKEPIDMDRHKIDINDLAKKENKSVEDLQKELETEIDMATQVIDEQTTINGYKFIMSRYNPSDFTYQDLFDEIRSFENQGFEIHMTSIDYLPMMNLKGCTGLNESDRIQNLYRRVRNFMTPRNIACVTAHQFSSDATKLLREGRTDFIKEIAGKSFYKGCTGIDQEVDWEMGIHIEKPGDGKSYLTMHRGKHRKPTPTDEKYLYQVYSFGEVGIPDDINGASQARKTVGGNVESEGGGRAWFDV
ncbi:DnaB family ATPase [Endozoicomonas sp. ONNA1]|uniref:DnaB family ATPase n=1 Tax=Endozoicomonas sp. ONNA1 TaxID=2828740 RepID=UPI00214821A8|nr:DnaB family ATPase [Endozoicomonas sp. ONNA1]